MAKTTEEINDIADDVLSVIRARGISSMETMMVLTVATQLSSTWLTSEFTRNSLGLPLHTTENCRDAYKEQAERDEKYGKK